MLEYFRSELSGRGLPLMTYGVASYDPFSECISNSYTQFDLTEMLTKNTTLLPDFTAYPYFKPFTPINIRWLCLFSNI